MWLYLFDKKSFIFCLSRLNHTFSENTSLEELYTFIDSLDCPNYTYSDVLKLYAHFISKKEIGLCKTKHFLSDDEQDAKDVEFIQKMSNEQKQEIDDDVDDDESDDIEVNTPIEEDKPRPPRGKLTKHDYIFGWTEEETECLIKGVNKFGNHWVHIIHTYPKILGNKAPYSLRGKAKRLRQDPKYAAKFKKKK